MRNLSLLLSVLLSFVSIVSLSYASSGDIIIGTKTYTQSEAQKQIVEPLLKRIERQKIAKTKIRLINLAIRQYTNKQKIAQKQGKTDLVNFYNSIIDTLKGKVNIISTGSTSVYIENQGNHSKNSTTKETTQNSTTNQSSGTANRGGLGTTSDQTGLTGQAYDESKTRGEVMTTYNNVKTNPNITKAQFLQAIAEDFGGTSSYAYKYAQTLSFENSSSTYNANHGGLGTTSDQTGLTGQAYDESKTRGEVKTDYNIYKYYGVTKTEFLNEIIRQYGKDSYAHKYAQTLNY